MKTLLLVIAFLLAMNAFGKGTQITASGGSPIPSSYSAVNTQSQVQVCDGNVVEILNQTSTVLGVAFGTSSTAPSTDYAFVPGGPASGNVIRPDNGFDSNTYVYIRGVSSITSGTVQVSCYREAK